MNYLAREHLAAAGILPPVIVFGSDAWNDAWQTRQQIVSRLVQRNWPTVYSCGAFHTWDRFRPDWSAATWRGAVELRDGVKVYRPGRWQMRWPKLSAWDDAVVAAHAASLTRLVGWSAATTRIAYLFHPRFLPYLAHLGDCRVVYHCDDAFAAMPNWTAVHARQQEALIDRADLIIASSPGMAKALPGRGAAVARLLANGADTEAYIAAEHAPCPPDLAAIPRPRIGYSGGINQKVDLELVATVARRRPDWHWVLVGRVLANSGPTGDAVQACRQLPNVHFLGVRPYDAMPPYVAHMDVNALCYRSDPGGWWFAGYPLKLHEYLAAGRPVVGAGIEVVAAFDAVIAIADGAEQWIAAIDDALRTGGVASPEARRRVARQNDWELRLDDLEAWLKALYR